MRDGNKLNRLTFEQGYATFHLLPEHHDAYSVKIARRDIDSQRQERISHGP